MKNPIGRMVALLFIVGSSLLLQGCFKDTVERTNRYIIYTPVYKTVQEVRDNIKTLTAVPIQYAGKIYMKDQYLFIADSYKGIHIIDNTNPSAPKNIGFLDIPRNMDLGIKDNTLYADMYSDLLAIDITDPKNAKLKTVSEKVFPGTYWQSPDDKIITSWLTRDTVVVTKSDAVPKGDEKWYPMYYEDGSVAYNASSSSTVGTAYGVGGSLARFAATKERLFTVGQNNLSVFNIQDAFLPKFVTKKDLGWGIETIFPFQDNLFIGSTTGVKIFGLANVDNPEQLGEFGHVRKCDPVVTDGKNAFITLRAGGTCGEPRSELQILSVETLTSPQLIKSYTLENPYGLSLDGKTLFVCDGSAGLKIYNVTDVNDIKLIKQIKDINPFDVIAKNGLAVVIGAKGIYQYDYKDVNTIKLLSTIEVKGPVVQPYYFY